MLAMYVVVWSSVKGNFMQKPWIYCVGHFICCLPWIAIELGWFVAEYGRQPWTIYGVLPTHLSIQYQHDQCVAIACRICRPSSGLPDHGRSRALEQLRLTRQIKRRSSSTSTDCRHWPERRRGLRGERASGRRLLPTSRLPGLRRERSRAGVAAPEVPGGTTSPELRIRSGSSSLITTRSKRGFRYCCAITQDYAVFRFGVLAAKCWLREASVDSGPKRFSLLADMDDDPNRWGEEGEGSSRRPDPEELDTNRIDLRPWPGSRR